MNFVSKLMIIIFFVLSTNKVFADDIGVIYLVRQASKIEFSQNGTSKILEYRTHDLHEQLEYLLESNIDDEAEVAKHSIVRWLEIQHHCKLPHQVDILDSVEYLNPNMNLENSLGEMAKYIYKIKSQLAECGINNVLFNVIEESVVMTTDPLLRNQLKIGSLMIDYSRGTSKIKLKTISTFQTKEFDVKSQHPKFDYKSEIENHAKKLFKKIN